MSEIGADPKPGCGHSGSAGAPMPAEIDPGVHAEIAVATGAVVQIGMLEVLLGPGRPAPAELPTRIPGFAGRAAETAQVVAAATSGELAVQISGRPGSGKTALAVAAAHALSGAYPDGQVAVALHGHDSARAPTAHELLAAVLRTLDVADRDIPANHAARSALYRAVLAERRVLLLADDAASRRQVDDLVPTRGRSFVIVTTRRVLTGLAAAQVRLDGPDDAHPPRPIG